MNNTSKIDLHIHTTVSDGTDKPEDIISRVKNAGIELFSVTDHDAVKGCRSVIASRKDADPLFMTGVEFSCRDDGGKYHILGYGYDMDAPAINKLVYTGHSVRMSKVTARLDFLKERFGFRFEEEDIQELLARDNPGKPHLANLMVKYGYAVSKEEAIRSFINQLKLGIFSFRPEDVIEGILKSGGIPVLAHPTYGNGDQLILGEEMEHRIKHLMEFGLQGLEAFYSGFTPRITEELLGFADRFDLFVTAGSDYHGTNKLIALGDTGAEKLDKMPMRMESFLREVRKYST